MCVECAHVIQFSALSAAGVLAYLHRVLVSKSQKSQMRVVAFPACRSGSENREREVFSTSTGRCAVEKPIERGAEKRGDAS
jgi:hypothetical protein